MTFKTLDIIQVKEEKNKFDGMIGQVLRTRDHGSFIINIFNYGLIMSYVEHLIPYKLTKLQKIMYDEEIHRC